jgi:hypothetical protein
LVVRIRHAKGKPIFAQLRDERSRTAIQGAEHQFYLDAGKYTGVFWPVVEMPENAAIQLISVDAFKRDKDTRHAKLTELPPPDARDVGAQSLRARPPTTDLPR